MAITKGKAEALTIAKDSTQRLWVTYVEGGKVKVNWTRAHDLDWGEPVDLPVSAASAITVDTDDISAIVAFGGSNVGIAWSNQRADEMYFAVHRDADAPQVWQPVERIVPGPGCSGACADDHVNLKADGQGRVFVASKTSLNRSTDPLVLLSVRSGTGPGSWASYPVGSARDHHTRPIVLLDEENNRVYVLATSGENGGAIYLKSAPLDDISFASGLGEPFIKSGTDTTVNNVTSTKQNIDSTTGLLALACDGVTRVYLHNYRSLGAGASPPAAPTGLAAAAVSSTRVDLSWTDASTNEDEFSIERATGSGAFSALGTGDRDVTSFSDTTTAAGTTYSYRVRARNAAGFSEYSNTATVTTPAPVVTAPAAPTGLTATAVSSTRVNLSWTDASTNEDEFRIERAAAGGSFTELVIVPANFTTYADTTVAATSSYTYRVRSRNTAGFSAYSNTASVTTPGDSGGGGVSSPIRVATFEAGALTGTDGVERIVGTVLLETASPLKGRYSARIPNVGSSNLDTRFTATDDLYVSLYIRLNALPASDVRLVVLSNAGTSVGNLLVRTSGVVRLRAGSTTVGVDSAPLQVGQLYRLGIRQKKGTSGNAVLEAYVAAGDAAFGAPFASTVAGTWTTGADRLSVGATTTTPVDVVVDDLRLDAAVMPGPSGQ